MRLRHLTYLPVALLMVIGVTWAGGDKKGGLPGTWEFEKDGKKITLTFTKKEFNIVMNEAKGKGTYKIDGKKDPKHIDMAVEDGEGQIGEYKGKTSLGIFELKGDTLKWCANQPGRDQRPTEFAEVQGDAKYLFVELKRAK